MTNVMTEILYRTKTLPGDQWKYTIEPKPFYEMLIFMYQRYMNVLHMTPRTNSIYMIAANQDKTIVMHGRIHGKAMKNTQSPQGSAINVDVRHMIDMLKPYQDYDELDVYVYYKDDGRYEMEFGDDGYARGFIDDGAAQRVHTLLKAAVVKATPPNNGFPKPFVFEPANQSQFRRSIGPDDGNFPLVRLSPNVDQLAIAQRRVNGSEQFFGNVKGTVETESANTYDVVVSFIKLLDAISMDSFDYKVMLNDHGAPLAVLCMAPSMESEIYIRQAPRL